MTSLRLRPHACGFFSSTEVQNRVLTEFVKEGVQRGCRVIYTTPPDSSAILEDQLGAAGVDVECSRESGCLLLQDWNTSYCPDGNFVPERTLNFWGNQVRGSLDLGHQHIRFISHMGWANGHPGIEDVLLDYEARANDAWKHMRKMEAEQMRKIELEVLCVYDASRFDATFLMDVMRTHPYTVLNGVTFENPYYVPPEEFIAELRARRRGTPAGGLAPWQLRRVKALLTALEQGSPSIHRLAEECGLSSRQFARAFTRSTGLPPHRWLLEERIKMAKRLLVDPAHSLADIALACGFASQSHFTRVFSARVGQSPGSWRRMHSS